MQIRTSERNEGNQGKWNFNKNLLHLFSVASCIPIWIIRIVLNIMVNHVVAYLNPLTNAWTFVALFISNRSDRVCRFHRTGDQMQPWRITIVAGSLKINQLSETAQKRGVNEIHVHAEFNPKTLENDIALLAVRSFKSSLLFNCFHFHVLMTIILSRWHLRCSSRCRLN